MNLNSGSFYLNESGKEVKCQIESDGDFHIYDVSGKCIQTLPQKTMYPAQDEEGKDIKREGRTHVNGWTPISRAVFLQAKQAASKSKDKLPKRKKK